ncbi:CysB family HTH-type transcriptional regulator [Thiolinea disciformis]|uniref:CysB family HTH-type transcriptional regulator n=1 Tax=Thiolinea disciformis TaxID=125614 RepID=UPI00035C9F3C|nr:CysB family HTH-type transcriptional regulator [Thiolinea disciformis]
MNFQQLRILQEAVRQNYNLTEVANALFTSQSGVSKHIKDLEDELGIEIFIRRGKRFLGLTEPGQQLLEIVKRMLIDANNIKQLADQFSNAEAGSLDIATTHTQACYKLPPIITAFKKLYPRVHLAIHQAKPNEIAAMLQEGKVDIGIATESLMQQQHLATFPFYVWSHALIVPKGHPLEKIPDLSLEAIAEYPLITYFHGMTGRLKIDEAFSRVGVTPDIIMSALDSDVIKTYVSLGLGIGIIASVAINPERDTAISLLDCSHLFEPNTTYIAVRRGHYLRGYAYRFMELCSARLNEQTIREALTHITEE